MTFEQVGEFIDFKEFEKAYDNGSIDWFSLGLFIKKMNQDIWINFNNYSKEEYSKLSTQESLQFDHDKDRYVKFLFANEFKKIIKYLRKIENIEIKKIRYGLLEATRCYLKNSGKYRENDILWVTVYPRKNFYEIEEFLSIRFNRKTKTFDTALVEFFNRRGVAIVNKIEKNKEESLASCP